MPIALNVFLTIPMNSLSEAQEDQALVPEDTVVVVDMKIKRFKCYYFLRIDKVDISPEDNRLCQTLILNRKPISTRIATVILKV